MIKPTFKPKIRPFMRNLLVGNVSASTLMTGTVSSPQAKYSRKMMTSACTRLASRDFISLAMGYYINRRKTRPSNRRHNWHRINAWESMGAVDKLDQEYSRITIIRVISNAKVTFPSSKLPQELAAFHREHQRHLAQLGFEMQPAANTWPQMRCSSLLFDSVLLLGSEFDILEACTFELMINCAIHRNRILSIEARKCYAIH